MFDSWILPLLGGILLGIIFFGGLWYTITHGVVASHPEIWFLLSLLARMSLAVVGFVVLSRGRWDRLLACLAGFLMARIAVLYWLPLPLSPQLKTTTEEPHASE